MGKPSLSAFSNALSRGLKAALLCTERHAKQQEGTPLKGRVIKVAIAMRSSLQGEDREKRWAGEPAETKKEAEASFSL